MKIKYIEFKVYTAKAVENRLNEELAWWKIKSIPCLNIKEIKGVWHVDFVGEIGEF